MIVSVTTFSIKFFHDILAVDTKGYEKRILKIVTFFNSPSESDPTDSLFFFFFCLVYVIYIHTYTYIYIYSLRLRGFDERFKDDATEIKCWPTREGKRERGVDSGSSRQRRDTSLR